MNSEEEYEYRKNRYESYSKEREGLRDASLQISERYDKWMLFLAGGALALSITFIEKIAPHPQPWTFFILMFAWLLLIASVVLELHALATSQTAIYEQVSMLDIEYREFVAGLDTPPKRGDSGPIQPTVAVENRFAVRTRALNKWSLRCLVAGIAFLCIFSAANLPFLGDHPMPNQENVTINSKGSFVPPRNILPPPPPPSPPVPSAEPEEASKK